MHDVLSPALVDSSVVTLRPGQAAGAPHRDRLAAEAPLEIRFGTKAATVVMRTPGEDEELVRGFLFGEGLIGNAADILALTRPQPANAAEEGNVIAVSFAPERGPARLQRTFFSSSSCGVCGKNSIASLAVRAEPVSSALAVRSGVLARLPARMREAQATFRETGGVHASALFTADGALVALREDVGRHNALDKLVGWALAAGRVPLAEHLLLVSGRVSYEIVQKAVVAGLPLLAAVGAPSSLAVELAESFGQTLVGFLREDSMNVYTHPRRVIGS